MTLAICLKYITRYAVETVHLLFKYGLEKQDQKAGCFFISFSFVNIVHSNTSFSPSLWPFR